MSIFVEVLQAQHIKLENGGIIQSKNYLPGEKGFLLDYNGEAEFNNTTVRGHIEANSGSFRGHIEATSGTFSGNVELNMTQYGNVRYPLLGGLRAFARGRRGSGVNFSWTLSNNVVAVNRVGVGHFEVIVSADNLINQEQIARAYESWDNLSPFWYRNPMRVEFNHGRSVSQNPFRFHIEFQFRRAANNALADPVIADIYWMG